jgi:hypothetical protein
MKNNVPPEILDTMARWDTQSSILQYTYIFFGVIAITAPLIVSTFTDLLGQSGTRLTSFAGAVAVGLIGGFRLAQKSNELRHAYHDLRNLVLRYKASDSMSEAQLIEEYAKISIRIGSIDEPGSEHSKLKQRG